MYDFHLPVELDQSMVENVTLWCVQTEIMVQ